MSGKVRVELKDDILYIGLNRPEKLNALDEEMWISIRDALHKYGDEHIAIVYGVGRAFSAGDDIKMMFEAESIKDTEYIVFELIKPLVDAIIDYKMPIMAAVDGYAFGAGFEMLLLMDVVISSSRSIFGVPEARIGLIPPLMLSLGRNVPGLRRAVFLSLTGYRLSAEEAMRLGIVDIIDEDPLGRAGELAKEVLKIPKETLRRIKVHANRFKRELFDEDILRDLSYLMAREESKHLMKLFLEKRLR